VCFPEIEKTFAVSSLVLNLFVSKIGEFFLQHPVRCVISDFHREVDENCALLSYYSASSGDSYRRFRHYHYSLSSILEERNSLPNTLFTDYFVKNGCGYFTSLMFIH